MQATINAARTNLAPLPFECDTLFPKVSGELPRERHGTLYRNGPNPQFDAPDARRKTAAILPSSTRRTSSAAPPRWCISVTACRTAFTVTGSRRPKA